MANTILKKNSKVGGTAVLSIIYRTYKPYYVPRIIQTGWYCQEGWTQRSRQWKRERARNRPAPMCPNDFDKGVNPVLGRRDSLVSRWPCCHSTGTGKIMSLIYTSRLAWKPTEWTMGLNRKWKTVELLENKRTSSGFSKQWALTRTKMWFIKGKINNYTSSKSYTFALWKTPFIGGKDKLYSGRNLLQTAHLTEN